jgi:hypothetical protein
LALLVATAALAAACATRATISSSPPGVEIYESDKKLGVTPLEITSETLKAGDDGGYLLRLERSGYHSVWLWIPRGVRGLNLSVNLQPFLMKEDAAPVQVAKAELDVVSAEMLGLQQSLLLGDSVPAARLEALTKAHPDLATSYFLQALYALRQGDQTGARTGLETAMRLAPSEPDYIAAYRDLGGDPLRAAATDPAAPATKPGTRAPRPETTEGG